MHQDASNTSAQLHVRFNGDWVDRGRHQLEVMLLILSLKNLAKMQGSSLQEASEKHCQWMSNGCQICQNVPHILLRVVLPLLASAIRCRFHHSSHLITTCFWLGEACEAKDHAPKASVAQQGQSRRSTAKPSNHEDRLDIGLMGCW